MERYYYNTEITRNQDKKRRTFIQNNRYKLEMRNSITYCDFLQIKENLLDINLHGNGSTYTHRAAYDCLESCLLSANKTSLCFKLLILTKKRIKNGDVKGIQPNPVSVKQIKKKRKKEQIKSRSSSFRMR